MNNHVKRISNPENFLMASALAIAALAALMPELAWAQVGKNELIDKGKEIGESSIEVAMVWIRNACVIGVIGTAIGAGFNMVDKKPAVRWGIVMVVIAIGAQIVDFILSFRST